MGKKNSGSPLLIGVVIVVGVVASVPKEVWIGLVVLGAAVYLIRQYMKAKTVASSPVPVKPSAQRNSWASESVSSRAPVVKSRSDSEALVTITVSGSSSRQEYGIPAGPSVALDDAKWVPVGQSVTIGGLELPGGMLYVGTGVKKDYRDTEPALINPNLKVSSAQVDVSLPLTDYWPSYSTISPDARKAYLSWLAGGRNAPFANIGYIFLFFYGLERRVLLDSKTEPAAQAEIPAIKAEIQRLLKIYSENNSFRRYATQFLEFLASTQVVEKSYLAPPPLIAERGYELPLGIRIGLGQLAIDQKPVPADWALAWALADPNINRRTPTTRCAELFSGLFKQKYADAYGAGFSLKINRTKLRVSYYPASSSLNYDEHSRTIADLPDVSAVKTPIPKLQQLVDDCTAELDPYSRYLGRNPDKAHALEGLLQLPVTLWPTPVRTELEDLKSRVGEGMVLMTFGELSGRLKSAGALTRDKVLGLARALESLHLGMEPDVLAGNKTPKAEDTIALFATPPENGEARNTPAYAAAAVTLDLACAAAYSDGQVSAHELLILTRQVDSWAHLSDAHRKRLKSHLRLGLNNIPTLAALKKKLEPLPTEAKRSIGRFLAHLTQSDGEVSPAEVKFLERVYKTLEIEAQQLYSDLHAVAEPGGVSPSSPAVSSTPKPEPKAGFTLNADRIAQLQKETEAVSALLAGIFTEEPHVEPDSEELVLPDEVPQVAAGILGLDADYSAFMRLLVSRHSWPREDLNDVAADMELMLDGTLEHINETTLDMFDAPLTEGDDPIEINQEILEKLSL